MQQTFPPKCIEVIKKRKRNADERAIALPLFVWFPVRFLVRFRAHSNARGQKINPANFPANANIGDANEM